MDYRKIEMWFTGGMILEDVRGNHNFKKMYDSVGFGF